MTGAHLNAPKQHGQGDSSELVRPDGVVMVPVSSVSKPFAAMYLRDRPAQSEQCMPLSSGQRKALLEIGFAGSHDHGSGLGLRSLVPHEVRMVLSPYQESQLRYAGAAVIALVGVYK